MSLPDLFASLGSGQSTTISSDGIHVPPVIFGSGHTSTPDSKLNPELSVNIDGDPGRYSIRTPYRAISTFRSALDLLAIIFANCICSLVVVLCLWGFSRANDLDTVKKRAFNTLSLLLSAAMGFGIGFLCDRIGLLARGAVLQSRAHPTIHIGYIIRGSFSAYFSLFIRRPANLMVLVYLLCAFCGRFGVAFLGFGYSVEQTAEYTPPLLRPDWVNMAISSGAYIGRTQSGSTLTSGSKRTNVFDYDSLVSMSQFAQIAKALPQIPFNDTVLQETSPVTIESAAREATKMENFLMPNLEMQTIGTTVQYRYKFQDMNGTTPQDSQWEALIESSCWRYDVLENPQADDSVYEYNSFTQVQRYGKNVSVPYLPANFNHTPSADPQSNEVRGPWRWIMRAFRYLEKEGFGGYDNEKLIDSVPRGGVHELWLMGQPNPLILSPQFDNIGDTLEFDFSSQKLFLFNCSFSIKDVPTPLMRLAFTDSLEDVDPATNQTRPRILGKTLYEFLRQSFVDEGTEGRDPTPVDAAAGITMVGGDMYRDFAENPTFNWGVGRKNQTDPEIWLAAYVGRYLVNQLSLLNDLLATSEIRPELSVNPTKLLVKWNRIALTLGGLLVFQVLFALLALCYCQGKFELLDDVWTISSLLEGFTDRNTGLDQMANSKRADCGGEFVQEGNGLRWELIKKKQD